MAAQRPCSAAPLPPPAQAPRPHSGQSQQDDLYGLLGLQLFDYWQGIAFLKISNVIGGSVDARHAGEMDISSWSDAAILTISSTGTGKVALKDIKIRKRIDRVSKPHVESAVAQPAKFVARGINLAIVAATRRHPLAIACRPPPSCLRWP